MSVYYNDNEPFVVQWLRNLIAAGYLPAGDVDERPIQEIAADDLKRYSQCHFFAGIGGWAYALQLADWGDRPVWTGSCPCQPFSAAGKGQAEDDPRHLWPHWFRLIYKCHPERIFGEQVANAIGHGWLDLVSTDLEGEGYAVGAVVLGAHSVGAPHLRQRLWFVADRAGAGQLRAEQSQDHREGCSGASPNDAQPSSPWLPIEWLDCRDGKARPTQPGLFPLASGIPGRVGRLRAYGNAIVPQVAAEFIKAFLAVAP